MHSGTAQPTSTVKTVADALRRVVHPVDGAADRVIHALGLLADPRGDSLHVRKNGVDFLANRGDLARFEIVDEGHDARVHQVTGYADPDQQQRLEHAQDRHDPQRDTQRVQIATHVKASLRPTSALARRR